ncbi:MAG: ROK family protein, partial [Candidatus Omnitrophota bacterium]
NFGLILAGCLYSGSSGFVGKIALNDIRKTDSPDKKYCWMTEDCILRNQNNFLYENNNFKEMTSYFGIKIATAVNFLNPELVIIGGCSLKDKDGEVFLESIRNSVKRWAFEETIANVKIIPSQLDDMGVCLGVTSLLTRELFTQV